VPAKLLPAAAIATFLPRFLRTNGSASLKNAMSRNKPLMACTKHWKSFHVLPMFRRLPLAFDPGIRRCAPERGASDALEIADLEMPIWMK
jgi:hypothetical protein